MTPVGLQLLLEVMEGFRKKSPVCFVISHHFFMGLDFTQQLKTYQSRSPLRCLREKSTQSPCYSIGQSKPLCSSGSADDAPVTCLKCVALAEGWGSNLQACPRLTHLIICQPRLQPELLCANTKCCPASSVSLRLFTSHSPKLDTAFSQYAICNPREQQPAQALFPKCCM